LVCKTLACAGDSEPIVEELRRIGDARESGAALGDVDVEIDRRANTPTRVGVGTATERGSR
jgi:hypothetical protein